MSRLCEITLQAAKTEFGDDFEHLTVENFKDWSMKALLAWSYGAFGSRHLISFFLQSEKKKAPPRELLMALKQLFS